MTEYIVVQVPIPPAGFSVFRYLTETSAIKKLKRMRRANKIFFIFYLSLFFTKDTFAKWVVLVVVSPLVLPDIVFP